MKKKVIFIGLGFVLIALSTIPHISNKQNGLSVFQIGLISFADEEDCEDNEENFTEQCEQYIEGSWWYGEQTFCTVGEIDCDPSSCRFYTGKIV